MIMQLKSKYIQPKIRIHEIENVMDVGHALAVGKCWLLG